MEPLVAGDPTEIGEYVIRGKSWVSGALTAYLADSETGSVILIAVKNGPHILDSGEHDIRVRSLADSLATSSEQLGAKIINGGSTDSVSFLVYQIPQGTSLRDRMYQGKHLDSGSAEELQVTFEELISGFPNEQRILITPDTVYANQGNISITGLGVFELLEVSAAQGSSLGVNALEWFAPETLNEGIRTNQSAKFSIAACLFAATAGSPWSSPIRTMGDLFARSLDIGKLQANPELGSLVTWLNALPELRELDPPEVSPTPGAFETETVTERESFTKAQPAKRPPFVLIGIVSVALLAAIIAIGVNALGGDSESATTATETPASEEVELESESAGSVETEPVVVPDPVYQVRLDYASDTIPNQVPTDGLNFTFDVCSGDTDWITKNFQKGVQLQKKQGASWIDVVATPTVVKGGRCDSDQYNMTVTHPVEPPNGLTANGTWSTCLSYRVTLPESASFKKFSVPFCAFVRQTA